MDSVSTPPKPRTPPKFTRFAKWAAQTAGRPATFLFAALVVVTWAVTGPVFRYSDTWQLVINTSTTIITFLMVFLIQNTQNRDSQALHVKLDELIRAMHGARNSLLDLENFTDEELERIRSSFVRIAERAKKDALDGPDNSDASDASAASTPR